MSFTLGTIGNRAQPDLQARKDYFAERRPIHFCMQLYSWMLSSVSEVEVSLHSSLYDFFWHDALLLNLLFILLFCFSRSRICLENFTAARNLSVMSLFWNGSLSCECSIKFCTDYSCPVSSGHMLRTKSPIIFLETNACKNRYVEFYFPSRPLHWTYLNYHACSKSLRPPAGQFLRMVSAVNFFIQIQGYREG